MWLTNLLSLLAALVPRFLKAKDSAKRASARAAIVKGDKEAVNKEFDGLLKMAMVFLGVLFLGGCSTYTVVAADRELVPVERVDDTFFKVSQENGKVDGWYVPTAVLLDIRDKLSEE